MANPEHVKIVKQGREAIDQWREANPGQILDLSEVNLSNTKLVDTNLSRADLSGADLSRADLSGADLSRADLSRAYLSRADLSGADLFRADLSRANLSRAYLSGTYLSGADLSGADLSRANLLGADLSRANLLGANLSETDLSKASLKEADLAYCNFYKIHIYTANLEHVKGIFIVPMHDPRGKFVSFLQIINDEVRFLAGCRSLSLEEARAHWGSYEYPDPDRGQLYIEALDWIESSPRAQAWIQAEKERLKEMDHGKS